MAEKEAPPENQGTEQGESAEDKSSHDLEHSGDEEEIRKRQRQTSPTPSPRFSYSPSASPHKHATFEELLAAAERIQKLSLAHEVVTDDNFKLSPRKIPENTIHKVVHDMVHKAFWDIFSEELEADPPTYDQAIRLLGEIKERLILLLMPGHGRLKTRIDEVLDLDLIRQQAVNSALDVSHYSEFIISVMAKLCAPVRDDEIAKLKTIEGVVPLYRGIFRVVELMQVDMANYALDTIKPHLKQQSVEYEREQFDEILKTQQDGLVYTRKWLRGIKDRLVPSVAPAASEAGPLSSPAPSDQPEDTPDRATGSTEASGGPEAGDASGSQMPEGVTISPLRLLNRAYIGLLEWDVQDYHQYPETALTDRERFLELGSQLKKACLIASVLLVTYTNVGPALSGIQGFPSKLKHGISVIVADASDFQSIIPNIAEQVCREVSSHLTEIDLPQMKPEQTTAMKNQVLALGEDTSSLRKLIDTRAKEFLLACISSPPGSDLASKIPASLKTLQRQMLEIAGLYTRLVRHNRAVYGPHYSQILAKILQLPK